LFALNAELLTPIRRQIEANVPHLEAIATTLDPMASYLSNFWGVDFYIKVMMTKLLSMCIPGAVPYPVTSAETSNVHHKYHLPTLILLISQQVKRICINMLNHFNQRFLRRILITMTTLINRTLMMTLILNGSIRI
jgi:hypothetical protein